MTTTIEEVKIHINSDETPAKTALRPIRTKISLEEVKKHHSFDDAWVVIDNKVYDITQFIRKHPGGKEILKDYLGKDATHAFKSDEIHSHSNAAHKIVENYRVGDLCTDEDYDNFQEHLRDEVEFCKLEDLHKNKYGIDLNNPIILQIGKLGNKYLDWINEPIPQTINIFGPAWMEVFTRTKWWVVPLFWCPILFTLGYACISSYGFDVSIFGLFVAGLLGWIVFEYCFHRYVYHWVPPPYCITNILHFLLHGCHHLVPMDGDRLVAPPLLAIAIASPGILCYYLMPLYIWEAFFVGFGIGYIVYDLTHYYVHFSHPTTSYGAMIKRNHMMHHYKDHDKNYGVSNPLLDYVFGTI